jgi:hypothetical protein
VYQRPSHAINSLHGPARSANGVVERKNGVVKPPGMVMVCLSVYLYGDKPKAAVERDEPTWQKWMGERFPMPQTG